jgi:WD40 repeat protein/serine/threonine protein kinase
MNEEELFHQALAKPVAERGAFFDVVCGGDDALRQRLQVLLQAHENPGSFLQSPALTVDAPIKEQPGTVIGPYKLMEQIGEGGMGLVFVAEQQEPIRRKVALKVIKPGMDTRQVIARFEAERQALALLDHPNIAKVYDGGVIGEPSDVSRRVAEAPETRPLTSLGSPRPYFVMELVKGVPITKYCDEHRLTPKERLELFIPVCQAIQHAHQKGIIHRDIKPSNVLVALYDGKPVPKVIDFGIAKATGQQLTEHTLVTGFGAVVGTLEYMSPEQAELNQLDIDTRSDIYSLGVLLYELLTGTTPLQKKRLKEAALLEVLRIIREEEPPKPSTRLSTTEELPSIAANRGLEPKKLSGVVRGELDWIVMKALEKDRNRRYDSANALAMEIQRYLADEPVLACPPSSWYRFRKFARRNKGALMTAALISAALVLAVVVLAVSNARIRQEQEDKDLANRHLNESLEREKETSASLRQANYFKQIALAFREWQANQVARADQLLDDCPDDLRGWEWHYLKRLCHGELLRVPTAGQGHSPVFSPDALRIALAADQVISVCDASTGKQVQSIPTKGHRVDNGNQALAFSPDGRRLASAGSDGRSRVVHLWDVVTGQALLKLEPRKGPDEPLTWLQDRFWGVAFSPDGRRVAVGSGRGNVFVWDAGSAKELRRIAAHPLAQTIKSPGKPPRKVPLNNMNVTVAFSPDGAAIASASWNDGTVKLWNAETGELVKSLGRGEEGHGGVAFSPKGTWIAAFGLREPVARVWNAKTGQTRHVLRHGKRIDCLAFGADESWLATAGVEKLVQRWDLRSGQDAGSYRGRDQGSIVALALTSDGKRLVSWGGGAQPSLRHWDTAHGLEMLTIKQGNGAWDAALDPDGGRVATASLDEAVYLFDSTTGAELRKLQDNLPPRRVAFSPDGLFLAAALGSVGAGAVVIWNVRTGAMVRRLPDLGRGKTLGAACAAVAFSSDGKRIAAGTQERSTRVWDVASGKEVFGLGGHARTVTTVAFSRDGRWLASASGGGNWHAPRGFNPLKLRDDDPKAVPDLKLWDAATGQEVLTLRLPGMMGALAFSPDGEFVAVGLSDTVRLYSTASGRETRTLASQTRSPPALAFSPDGRRLVTADWDETIKLWDAKTGQEIFTLAQLPSRPQSVAFSPDGRKIVVASYDAVRVWDGTPLKK